ncbi:MAG: VOC family protein [Acidimicrobiales bacterium]
MPPIVTNLWFDANAVDAAQFYTSIFPNSRVIPGLAGPGDTPVTVDFELDGHHKAAKEATGAQRRAHLQRSDVPDG